VRVPSKREGLSLTLKHRRFMMRQRVATFKSFKTIRLVDNVDTKFFWWVTSTVVMIAAHQGYRQTRMACAPPLDCG
jgi:uncharacterized membrane protein